MFFPNGPRQHLAQEPPVAAEPLSRSGQVCVDLRGLSNRYADTVRVMVIGDVLSRLLKETGTDRVSVITIDDASRRLVPTASATRELGVLPTQHIHSVKDAIRYLTDIDAALVAPAGSADDRPSAQSVYPVANVSAPRWSGFSTRLPGQEQDQLALKLALLRFPHANPAVLTAARLRRAAQTLDRWRLKVAGWKDQPAGPQPELEPLWAVFTNDLRTDQVLREMHRIETDHTISSSAKYRTFAALDDVLALDLHRKCGHGHWWRC